MSDIFITMINSNAHKQGKSSPSQEAKKLKKQIARLSKYTPHKKQELFILRSRLVRIENKSFSQPIKKFSSKNRGVIAHTSKGAISHNKTFVLSSKDSKRAILSPVPSHKITSRGDIKE